MRPYALISIIYVTFSSVLIAQAAEPRSCTAKSGGSTVTLLELYTSEGCSSCPAADAWLATLPSQGLVPHQVVPLALHVDYWDYLDWPDPFSQKLFSQRQYAQAKRNRLRTVYTPQVLLNGRDLPRWRSAAEETIRRNSAAKPQADLTLTLAPQTQAINISAAARVKNNADKMDMFVAIYENNLTSHIEAGENEGLTLHHDFVVRKLIGPIALDQNNSAHFQQEIKLDASWKQNAMGVAIFAQNRVNGEIGQALALPFCQ